VRGIRDKGARDCPTEIAVRYPLKKDSFMTITVSLIMHSSRSANYGVGALTESEIAIVRDAAKAAGTDVHIQVIDWKEPRTPYISGPDISVWDMTGKDLANPLGYFAKVRASDVVIDIGAGDSFADIYGQRRLTRMFAKKFLTHLAGTPLVQAPQTVGPFEKKSSERLARATMKRCAVVATRDAMSTKCAQDMNLGREIIEASDVAFRLPYDPPAPKAPGARPTVGLNISGLLMAGGYTRKNMFGLTLDYPAMIRRLVTELRAQPDDPLVYLVPHVIPSVRGSVEDDVQPSIDLSEEFDGVEMSPIFTAPSQAKTFIAGLDFFAGARMHACIAAFSSGVPVVPMAYSRKFEGLFGTLGYHRTVDCTSENEDAIVSKVLDGYQNRATLAEEIQPALAQGLEKLKAYEDALTGVLAEAARRKAR